MKDPDLVGKCLLEMKKNVKIPITCKCRIGVDELDSYEFLKKFIERVYEISKIDIFIIHAWKAFLQGLNPKQNREIPPLNYEFVYNLSKDFPNINFFLNDGLKTKDQCKDILENHK